MKRNKNRLLAMLCVLALMVGLLPVMAIPAAAAETHTVWLVGDSTVCSFNDAYYYPRYGYGTQLENYLSAGWTVKNLAASGRSSKSFMAPLPDGSKDNYDALVAGIQPGDVLIIGFGHNDEKAEAARYTNPNGDYTTEGSFAKSLYDNYVKMATDKGATAILCTPIVRRNDSGTLSNANCHITTDAKDKDGKNYPGGDYPKAIRDLGAATNTPVVDLTAMTKDLYERIGAAETLKLHAWTGMKESSVDNTHLNIYGAKKVAYMLADAIKTQNIAPLATGVDLSKGEPTEADRVPNPDYVEPVYTSDLPRSTYWVPYKLTQGDKTLTFRGSYFGAIGGETKFASTTIEADADGNMHISAPSGSKIASNQDGLAVYYYRLPAGVPFNFSATVKLSSALDNQRAFGLMVRDDMYIDVYDTSIKSDYVAAGVLGGKDGVASACFRRQDGKLTKGPTMAATPAPGTVLDLSINYNGDGYACTVGSEPTQSGGYDYQLTSVDSEYVYLCLFATRETDVTYSNIKLEVEGGLPEEDPEPIDVYLAGDSTVKDYSATGMNVTSADKAKGGEALGSWGEFLQTFFNEKAVAVTSHAHGGRSSRSFINEGRLDSIKKFLSEGDYLFIQFGHNDASDNTVADEGKKTNKEERFVPLGTPDASGKYPVTAPTNAAGPYTWDCGGTYKWFLKQYVDAAKAAKATPVLVTPVARMYFNADGTIRPHHDVESIPDEQKTDAYVDAVRQLAEEENVPLIDMYAATKTLFEDAYAYGVDPDTVPYQIMGRKLNAEGADEGPDTTHCNKLGGMIEAAVMAKAIRESNLPLADLVYSPTAVEGKSPDGKKAFSVAADGTFTAYNVNGDEAKSDYWSGVGQKLIGDMPVAPTINAKGWYETIIAELTGVTEADVTDVSWSGTASGSLAGDDLTYLVREDANGNVRIDIPGLKAGAYTLKVTAKGNVLTAGVKVAAYDRSGYAHYNYTEGVGAYNDDGTLKDNAIVIYVTDENKDTVTLTVGDKSLSGIGNILNTSGYKTNGANGGEAPKILMELSRANKPLVIRIVGEVNAPKGVSEKAGKSNGSMCYMKYAKNVTIEGIGSDATIKGWGVSFSGDAADAKNDNWGKNFEVRNLAFKEVPEDCVEITGNANGDGTIKEPVAHIWVHNCAFYRPADIADPAESDKKQGDGSVDFKSGQYMTMSYNYFERNHKTSLIGGGDSDQQYHVTWHHNWWKDVSSRAPLARQADMHIYNNLYEGQTGYCMSLRANTYIFSEYNTFLNCKDPVIDEGSGGVCKSYNDTFTNCTGKNDATVVTDRGENLTSTNPFANFDVKPESYLVKCAYKLDKTSDAVVTRVKATAGPMKALADIGTLTEPPAATFDCKHERTQTTVEAVAATCTEAGRTAEVVCLNCSQVITASEVIPATGHNYGDDGVCANCGDVQGVKVTGVKLNRSTATVQVTRSITLRATVSPADAAVQSVYWTSDDTSVATVDQDGVVTGVAEGKANITATTNDGGFTATCAVTVTAKTTNTSGGSSSRDEGRGDNKPTTAMPFVDVAESDWFYAPVKAVYEMGLMKGVDDTHFDPYTNTSRAMVATILYRLDGEQKVDVNAAFQDVADGTWYTEAVAWAAAEGIVKGYDETTFAPDDAVTREQLAVMLFRYANPTILDKSDALGAFTDATSVSDWAVQAMQWAVKVGILNGKGDGILDPQGIASRAEVCAMIQRYVDLEK